MIPVCARCAGIYPVALLIVLSAGVGWLPVELLPTWLLWPLPFPAVAEAITDWLEWREGTKGSRFLTGLLLGIALGVLMHRFLQNAADPLVWSVLAFYGIPSLVVAVVASRRRAKSSTG
jgi:uncharacterized membrane protein